MEEQAPRKATRLSGILVGFPGLRFARRTPQRHSHADLPVVHVRGLLGFIRKSEFVLSEPGSLVELDC